MSELHGESELRRINVLLNPRDDPDDTYQTMRDLLTAGVHDNAYGFYLSQWIDYHAPRVSGGAAQWRLKIQHDIRLKDGREFLSMYPNGQSWSGKGGRFNDDDVSHIRVSLYSLLESP